MIGRISRAISFTGAVAVLLAAPVARAGTTSDHPAAIVVYPEVRVDRAADTDTRIQLTNTSDELVDARCFYESIERECVDGEPGQSCEPGQITCTGQCTEERTQIPFRVRLTGQQPLAWSASAGLTDFPLDGERTGPDGQSNAPSLVPPLGAGPIHAVLRCAVVAGATSAPVPNNVLVGLATIERRSSQPVAEADAAQYRATGIAGFPDAANGDTTLLLGGPEPAEYEACPGAYLLEHFFTGAPLRTGEMTAEVATDLVLATCGSTQSELPGVVVQFLVYNEFGQRFSTARPVDGHLNIPLAMIDTADPKRSIFSVNVSGTLAGRTQIRGIGGGVHAVAFETHRDRAADLVHTAAIEVHSVNEFTDGDRLVLPPLPCPCDCNHNDDVTIDELITGVGIAIGQSPIDRCRRCDRDENGQVGIDELVSSVRSSIEGCDAPVEQERPAAPNATAPPPAEQSTTIGPEITFFGLATADDQPLQPDEIDGEGRPVYRRPYGQGFTLIIEARKGFDNRALARSTYSVGGLEPDLQVLASQALGDGNSTVCELDGVSGGIPAVPDLAFTTEPSTIAAMNDLGCRAYNRLPGPANTCTRSTRSALFDFVGSTSELQFCIPIARAWALPAGQTTTFAARLRNTAGTFGPVSEMVVHVDPLP